jgi:hypothetical protein
MINIPTNLESSLSIIMFMAFFVNIITQFTKSFVPIATKLYVIIVSFFVNLAFMLLGTFKVNIQMVFLSSFIVAFISMYGFDTLKELWERFKKGENINEYNKDKS